MADGPDFRVLSFGNGCDSVRPYLKRKPYARSRTGCLACKQRRVKCDEGRPCCDRCLRLDSPCSYASDSSRAVVVASQPAPALTFDPLASLGPSQSQYGTPRALLLRHLFNSLALPMSGRNAAPLLALGQSQTYLLNVVLAIAASHMRHHCVSNQPSRVAERFWMSQACANFRTALAQPLNSQTADAIIMTSLIFSVLCFSTVEDDDSANSWIFSSEPDRLAWLSLQLGFRPLLVATVAFRSRSGLLHVFDPPQSVEIGFLRDDALPLSIIPHHWRVLLGLDDRDPDGHVFHDPARMAAHLRHVEPVHQAILHYSEFVDTLDMELRFRDMLEKEDERAVWLFGYWLGLMNRFSFWWLRMRVRMEWNAIRIWLDRRGPSGQNPRIEC
ncbi:C6 transcription factor [Ophiocordyceps camponoti-floridani]|uniref:C6 transcription factor n=1 Tax=Ophiocordyceps camponoti-floridani TaxID=2030778 RepID=A0A8H4VCS9_9HYPO|nr:C6 transcription factor [Ophiocordyceps camponoti-floridani]